MEGKLSINFHILLILADLTTGLIYKAQNDEVTLKPTVTGLFTEILWKHNGDKAVEFITPYPIREFDKFLGRTTLNTQTGELIIRNLEKTDSGQYKAEALVARRLQYSEFDVKVIDAVTPPRVKCEQNNRTGILRCQSEGDEAQYRWEGPNDLFTTWTDQPIELHVNTSDSTYTCVVKNPVSEERSEAFPAKNCFKGHSTLTWALVTSAVVVVLIAALSAFLIWVYCVHCRGSSEAPDGGRGLQSNEGEKGEGQPLLQRNKVLVPGGEDAVEENRGKTGERPSDEDVFGKPVSERKKRFEPPACSPNNVKHERRSIQRKDKTSETEAKVDEQKDKDTDQEPRAAEINTGSWSKNTLEDDSKTVGHLNSPAETLEEDGVKVTEKKSKQKDNSKNLEQNEQKRRDNEKESEEVMDLKTEQENRVSEMNTDSSNRKETHLGGQTVGRSDSPAETNEKEGEKEMDKKQNRVSDLKSDETTKTLQADTTIAEGSEMNSENNGNETMEQNIPEVTDVDTMEGKGSAGESSTNQKTAETENLDQNDTQTGTDVTQSAGDTDGETQSEHRDTVSVPGGEDAVEENRGKTGERPSDEDLFGEPVSERKKRFEPPACSPNNVKHERRSIQWKDKTSETEAKVDEQKDKDTDQEPRAAGTVTFLPVR
ncbi:uncharacterized protein LOC108926878 isoform X1 [Scleropages formosus]|uniref:uncharacterized protein LOC108926878 isoform X1 n=1 Tax=Scleropages formosus TaxID=113540 RepID=UPI0010FA6F10|nr:uncharacterized protein LOC108926878 isoform X1 [Scleropages formosus]